MTEIFVTPSDPSADHFPVYRVSDASGTGRIRINVPLKMPREQMYYWTAEWQRGERESLAEIEAGRSILFDSEDPGDVVRWLHESDDE